MTTAYHYLPASLEHLAEVPHVVYEAWAGDVCLYVGMTFDLKRRMNCHRSRSAWARGPHGLCVTEYPNRREAELAERQRIFDLQPANNAWIPSRRPVQWWEEVA